MPGSLIGDELHPEGCPGHRSLAFSPVPSLALPVFWRARWQGGDEMRIFHPIKDRIDPAHENCFGACLVLHLEYALPCDP